MNRRTLLRYGAAGAVSAIVGPTLSRAATPIRLPRASTPELEEATVAQLQEAMRSGAATARSIVEGYLQRIETLDRSGPTLRSVIEVNPEALAIAETRDRERKAGRVPGPLQGIPVLIKDNIDTHDRMHTSAGSLALAESIPPQDSFMVQRLREAGAIILGKTNLSEWANFRSTHSSSGWSGRGGQTRNPYALDRNPCGSSSGSGSAASASLATLTVGTETDGSIVCPSSACGLVGIKPTVGLVSRAGIIPISSTQDTAGPMTRTVTDAALLLSAITGIDPRDSVTRGSQGRSHPDYSVFLKADGLRGARIGVAREFFGFSDAVDKALEEGLNAMKSAGAVLMDITKYPGRGKLDQPEFEVLLYEFKASLNAYLTSLGANPPAKSLNDLIDFNTAHREQEMPFFGQEIFLMAEKKGSLTTPAYRQALATCRRISRTEGIDALLARSKFDAIVAPTGGPAWVTDVVNGDHFSGGSSTQAAVAGYPSITVPAGFVHGLPVGLSFFAGAYSEPTLIRLGYAFEQATRARKAPKFPATLDLASP